MQHYQRIFTQELYQVRNIRIYPTVMQIVDNNLFSCVKRIDELVLADEINLRASSGVVSTKIFPLEDFDSLKQCGQGFRDGATST
jgi:hypothetical protein